MTKQKQEMKTELIYAGIVVTGIFLLIVITFLYPLMFVIWFVLGMGIEWKYLPLTKILGGTRDEATTVKKK